MLYTVYTSKFNKESIQTLKNEMTLPEFITHKTFMDMKQAMELAGHIDTKVAIDKATPQK